MVKNKTPEVLALIPARSGSKGIPDKNIRVIAGKPLIAYSIEHALDSKLITRTVVSTDSLEYADIACAYGAEAPFLRPAEISQADSTDLEAFVHTLNWFAENEGYTPDVCVHLRPTHPVREVKDIDRMVQILLDNSDVDSVRSVVPASETPFKMWFRDDDGRLSPIVKTEILEAYNLPRQSLPQTYFQNAAIDVVRPRVITGMNSMTGERIFGYVMEHNFDIDFEEQLSKAETYLIQKETGSRSSFLRDEKLTFCFDIDGVIATIAPELRYDLASPRLDMIKIINLLYQRGHEIILFTARGSATGIDWGEVTRKQMSKWGVKHHRLLFDKPAADYYVDDKLISVEQLQTFIAD